MERKVRYLLAAILVAVLGIVTLVTVRNARLRQSQIACGQLEVSFADTLRFVNEDDVKRFLDRRYGTFIGEAIDSVKLSRIEDILDGESAISKSEAWTTSDGTLHVRIAQRAPEIRFQNGGKGFYVDSEGYIFPLHKEFTADVTVIEGATPFEVPEGYRGLAPAEEDREWLQKMLSLARIIRGGRLTRNLVTGISVNADGDIMIRTGRGEEQFIIGTPDNLSEKIGKIEKYYAHIVPEKGEGYYKFINLKYKNQIICRQKGI